MKKKILAAILAIALTGAGLTGCGSEGSGRTDNISNTNGTDKAAEQDNTIVSSDSGSQAEGDVTLKFSYWGDANEKAAIDNVLDNFTEATGINVEKNYIPEDYMTTLSALAASGDMPDCGYLGEDFVLEWYLEGMVESASDAIAQSDVLDDCLFKAPDGTPIAASIANETIILYYNKAVFDELGVAYPPSSYEDAWTWEEFVDVAKQLTVDQNGLHPGDEGFDPENVKTYGVRVNKNSFLLEPLLRSNGGGIFSDDGQEVILDRDESTEVLQAVADLTNVDYVAPPQSSSTNTMDMSAAFLSNTLAMEISGQWAVQSMKEAEKEDGITWGVAVLPYFKEKITGNTGTPVVMFSGSKHPKEQAMLAQYFMNPEYVLSMIQSGLWMPTSGQWYTDEEYTSQWVTEDFPENYRDAVVDYTLNCMQNNSWCTVAYTGKASDIWLPALDNVWNGTQDAKSAIGSVIGNVKEVHQQYLDLCNK